MVPKVRTALKSWTNPDEILNALDILPQGTSVGIKTEKNPRFRLGRVSVIPNWKNTLHYVKDSKNPSKYSRDSITKLSVGTETWEKLNVV